MAGFCFDNPACQLLLKLKQIFPKCVLDVKEYALSQFDIMSDQNSPARTAISYKK
jgi:hypothetical protein